MALKKAKLYTDGNGNVIQGSLHPVSTTTISYSTTQRNSSPIVAEIVRLLATTDCYILFGDSDVVVTSSTGMPLSGGAPEYFTTYGKQYIAAIQASSSGVLSVTIME
jgi:hypothetical protein